MKMKFVLSYLKSRLPILLAGLCIITAAVTSLVYGKYVSDEPLDGTVNIVGEGRVQLSVQDIGGGNYTVTNVDTATIPAYVRFTVVAVWVKEGMIWATPAVEGVDYTVSVSNCTALKNSNGFTYHYYNGPLYKTQGFPLEVTQVTSISGMYLRFQVIADGVQCLPADVAPTVWGVAYNESTNKWAAVAP